MSRFGNLKDRAPAAEAAPPPVPASRIPPPSNGNDARSYREGRKAITGYFSPELSFAMHTCARRNGMSLQALMGEAFDDVLRKYGESPIGDR